MVRALGLDPVEEEVYRHLVAAVRMTATEIAAVVGAPSIDTSIVLDTLVARGLVVSEQTEPPTFSAASPAVALGALLRQQRDSLRAAEEAVATLAEEHRAAAADHRTSQVVEVITDVDAVRHRFAQIQEAARHEVLSIVTPNLTVVPHRQNAAGFAGVGRGVRYRSLLDRSGLAQPGMVHDVIKTIECGQQIRVADHVAMKMVIVDRESAFVPLHAEGGSPASVLVQASGLIAILVAYFESTWERAYPLLPNAAGTEVEEVKPDIDEFDSRILALLLTGMTEDAVAGQLKTSRRTVQRRIHELMVKAGVETRIELGWKAARNYWA